MWKTQLVSRFFKKVNKNNNDQKNPTYSRDRVRVSRQRFQTFPGFHVPYPYALIELGAEETNVNRVEASADGGGHLFPDIEASHSPIRTRSGWTGGWSCSRRRSCCDLLAFLNTSPGLKERRVQVSRSRKLTKRKQQHLLLRRPLAYRADVPDLQGLVVRRRHQEVGIGGPGHVRYTLQNERHTFWLKAPIGTARL